MKKVPMFISDYVISESDDKTSIWYCLNSAMKHLQVDVDRYMKMHGGKISLLVCHEPLYLDVDANAPAWMTGTATKVYAVFDDDSWAWACFMPEFNSDLRISHKLSPLPVSVDHWENINEDTDQLLAALPLECRFDFNES